MLENIVFQYVDQPVNVERHVFFKRYLRIYGPRKWKKTHRLQRKTSVKTCFVTGKTPVNNGIQTVFPSVNRTLNTRKTIVFVELTMEENCWIMERILQFAASKTPGERWIFFSENVRKCVNNAAFSNIHNLFSERVNTIFFAVKDIKKPSQSKHDCHCERPLLSSMLHGTQLL